MVIIGVDGREYLTTEKELRENNERNLKFARKVAPIATPVGERTQENMKTKGGKVGGIVGGAAGGCGFCVIFTILLVVAAVNGWNPVGWVLIVVLIVGVFLMLCGACAGSEVGKKVNSETTENSNV